MEEKKLRKALARLPTILGGTVAKDHQIIEGDEGGCHYKITKERISTPPSSIIYMLSVSGSPKNRQRLVQHFIKILGRPRDQFQIEALPHISYVAWDAEKIDIKDIRKEE